MYVCMRVCKHSEMLDISTTEDRVETQPCKHITRNKHRHILIRVAKGRAYLQMNTLIQA